MRDIWNFLHIEKNKLIEVTNKAEKIKDDEEYLKHAIDKIEKIKLHLKEESLKTFLDSPYVRWILKEWNQLTN